MKQISNEEMKEISGRASKEVVKCVENMIDIIGMSVDDAMEYCWRHLPR